MKNNNDAYAFPMIGEVNASNPGERFAVYNRGMTLRDYFAAAALNECLAATDTMSIAAERAYQMADAMLEARGE